MAQNKIALVIGNRDYEVKELTQNPIIDAQTIGERLKTKGFAVYPYYNLDMVELEKKVDSIIKKVSSDDVFLFYFSGHGVEVDGDNYLIPIDNQALTDKAKLKHKSFKLDYLFDKIHERENKINIVMIDACRNNPFLPIKGPKGLSAVPQRKLTNIFLVFAGDAGVEVEDNGLFRKSFLKYIENNDPVYQIFGDIRSEFLKNGANGIYIEEGLFGDATRFQFTSTPTPTTTISPKPKYENAVLIDGLWYKNEPFTKTYKWQEATNYCSGLGDGWRLPSRAELMKLGNIQLYSYDNFDNWNKWFEANKDKRNKNSKGEYHFVDKRFIENMPEYSWFWTNESRDDKTAWVVSFYDGNDYWRDQSYTYYALCVRGE